MDDPSSSANTQLAQDSQSRNTLTEKKATMSQHPGSTFEEKLDAQIQKALEDHPALSIPLDFAARTALRAHALNPGSPGRPLTLTSRRAPHYGRNAAWVSLILLAAATLYLSPATLSPTHPFSPILIIQSILLLQLLALGLWLGSRLFPGNA